VPTAGDVRELLEDRPDLEPAVAAVLAPDPPFTFADLDLDSGAFGELVSRGVVERADGGYRVVDRAAVERALAGEVEPDRPRLDLRLPRPSVDRLEVTYLAGALALVVAFRLFALPNVYHAGHVVLSSNDPYYYRYWVGQLLANPKVTPSTLPSPVAKGEPLTVTSLWLAAKLLGGGQGVATAVMAWYPVVVAAVVALCLYVTARVVTDDRRVGLAAVAMLAVVPGHAMRTSLGFADHSPFDYAALGLTGLALAWLAREGHREGRWRPGPGLAAAGLLAVAVAAQSLAWDNSPILLAPLGAFLATDALQSVRAGTSPVRSGGPVVLGVFVAGGLTWAVHGWLGWHTTLVSSAPLLVAIGGVGVVALGELVHRLDRGLEGRLEAPLPTAGLGALEVVGLVAGGLALKAFRPDYWTRLTTSLQAKLLANKPIAEMAGLFNVSGGWLLLLGFAFFLGVPYLVWASVRSREDARWLPPAVYAWYFLALSTIQVRFVAELAPFLALFAGLGLLHLAERLDLARRPAPFTRGPPPGLVWPGPRRLGSLALVFLLVGSLGMVQVPIKTGQVANPQARSDTAFWIADYSAQGNLTYPANYVFSDWSWSRFYNFYVNGHSRSYGYAQSHFEPFVTSNDSVRWYKRLHGRGFVVTTPDVVGKPDQLGTRLQKYDGAASPTSPALVHFRLVHVTAGGRYKVFAVVPGAVIEGTAAPKTAVWANATVTVSGEQFEYGRRASANAKGRFAIRVAQPGTYRVGNATVTVPASAVRNGTAITVPRAGG